MRQLEPLTTEQRAYRYADVCRRAQDGPHWKNEQRATPKAIADFKKCNAELAKAMEVHLMWEAEYVAGLK